ncbi:MAG: hypothetical protein FWD17_07550 [Polyangiaceae bacterium]|nr:hypothetical protein [Polyangiaceae bacterium]
MTTERAPATPAAPAAPIACDVSKIPREALERLTADLRAVFSEVEDVTPLPDGFALRLPPPPGPGLLSKLGAIVDYDRLCCPFIRHAIVGEPDGGPVRLELTGGEGVKAFLAVELASLLPPAVAARAGLLGRIGCAPNS